MAKEALPDFEDIFEKPCRAFPGKVRYGSEKAALAHITRRNLEARVRTYPCKTCLGWHLSSALPLSNHRHK